MIGVLPLPLLPVAVGVEVAALDLLDTPTRYAECCGDLPVAHGLAHLDDGFADDAAVFAGEALGFLCCGGGSPESRHRVCDGSERFRASHGCKCMPLALTTYSPGEYSSAMPATSSYLTATVLPADCLAALTAAATTDNGQVIAPIDAIRTLAAHGLVESVYYGLIAGWITYLTDTGYALTGTSGEA